MPDLTPGVVTVVSVPPQLPVVGVQQPLSGVVTVLPVPGPPGRPGTSGAGLEFRQESESTVWTINHGLNRDVVAVTVYSMDLATQWDNVLIQPLTRDTVRLSFDDPTSGIALVL